MSPIRRGSSSKSMIDVNEVLDLGEMADPSLNVTVEVGVDNDPANAISEGVFIVDRDSVSGKVVVENRSPVMNEVRGTRDVMPTGLCETTFSETSVSENYSEDMRNC